MNPIGFIGFGFYLNPIRYQRSSSSLLLLLKCGPAGLSAAIPTAGGGWVRPSTRVRERVREREREKGEKGKEERKGKKNRRRRRGGGGGRRGGAAAGVRRPAVPRHGLVAGKGFNPSF